MTPPWENGWFITGCVFAVISLFVRWAVDRTDDSELWHVGLNVGVVTAILSLICLITGIVKAQPF